MGAVPGPARTAGDFVSDLERDLAMPVLVVASSWRPDIGTDLDLEAARAFAEVVGASPELKGAEKVGVVVIGRGGWAAFADHASRSLLADTEIHLFVPYFVTGWATLLALSADRVVMHPFASLGAYDVAPLHLEGQGSRGAPAGVLERIAIRRKLPGEALEAGLSFGRLGDDQGLGVEELKGLGLKVETGSTSVAELLWETFVYFESYLGMRQLAPPRYTESALLEEVEFEAATTLVGAAIVSGAHTMEFRYDTGSPDPDSGRYRGHWTRDSTGE